MIFRSDYKVNLSVVKIGQAAYQIITEGSLDMATGLLQVMMLGKFTGGKGRGGSGALSSSRFSHHEKCNND